MNLVPMLSGGTLTFIVFVVIAVFIGLGSWSLNTHVKRAQAPWESDLSEAGRQAERREHPGM